MPDDELLAALKTLDGRLTDIHAELKREGKKRDHRIRANRFLSLLCIAAIVAAGLYARSVHNDLQAAQRRTTSARLASCDQDNLKALNQRQAEKVEIRKLLRALVQAAPDPGLAQSRVNAFLNGGKKDGSDGYDAVVDRSHPYRDCTPEGIAKYLNIASSASQ